jgi:hypothetical protein
VLHGDPLIGRKLVNNPVSPEPPDPTILLATKGIVRQITDRLIVDMGHACLHLKRKGSPAIFIPRDHGSGQPRVGIVGDPQGDGFIVHLPKSTPSRCTARSRPNVNQEMPPEIQDYGIGSRLAPRKRKSVSQINAHAAHAFTKAV